MAEADRTLVSSGLPARNGIMMMLRRWNVLLLLLCFSTPIWAKNTLNIGILANRSTEQTLARWQPLTDYLEQQLGDTQVSLSTLDFDALQDAISTRKVDLVITNPAHYLMLAHRTNLSVPLASLVGQYEGIPMHGYGGTILVHAERQDLQTLVDLKKQRVAIIEKRSFSGYQAQAMQLMQAGLRIPDDISIAEVGMSQDLAVNAVVEGIVDAAFVRGGVYEDMLHEGKLKPGELRVLNAQDLPGFPLKVSTRLYPQWPVAAMPQLDQELAQKVTAALLLLPPGGAVAQAMGIHGFSIPCDYEPVHEVARALRLPPYDVEPLISWNNIWHQYRKEIIAILSVAFLILLLLANMIKTMRELVRAQKLIRQRTQQLEQERGHLRTLINTLPDLVWLKDADGIYLNCNPAFEQSSGIQESEIIGKTDYDLVAPEAAEAFHEQDSIAILADKPCSFEKYFTTSFNGYCGLFEITRTPMKDAGGKLIGVLGIAHDITLDRQIRERLFLSEERLRIALQGAQDGLWDWNLETSEVYYSPRWKAMLGFADDELENHLNTWAVLVHPDDKESALQRVNDYIAGKEERYEAEFRMRHKDGRWLNILTRAITACDEQGVPLVPHRLIGTYTDMTEHHQMLNSLLQSERQIRLLLESANSSIWGVDTHGCVTFINPMGAKSLGYTVEELIGRRMHELTHHTHSNGTHYPASECPIYATYLDGNSRLVDDDVFWRKDSSSFPVEYSTHPIYQESELIGAVVVAQDITERKQSEQELSAYRLQLEQLVQERTTELNAARKVAEAANHAKGMFLANMSHEIRTPLNAVLGLAQVGIRESYNRPKSHEIFAQILGSGNLLLSVINDILDFSKIEADQLQIERIRFNLGDVIDQVMAISTGRAREKGLDFQLDEAFDLPATCVGDPLRLTQILVNLVSNAIKFTERGWVRFVIQSTPDTLHFMVQDSGIGMNEEQLGHLFQPFVQADASTTRCFGGTGLGLSISSRLAKLMAGEIYVQSQPEQGASFELRIPLIDAEAQPVVRGLKIYLSSFADTITAPLVSDLQKRGVEVEIIPANALLAPLNDNSCLFLACEAMQNPNIFASVMQAGAQAQRMHVVCMNQACTLHNQLSFDTNMLEQPLRARSILALCCNQLPPHESDSATEEPGGRLKNIRILAAEDIEVNRLVLQEMFDQEGAQLICVENGQLACEQIQVEGRNAFDLVLTDIQMPVMDGYTTAQNIRILAPELPVIGLTAHAMAGERERCLAAGMVDYVTKPINIDTLVATILKHTTMNNSLNANDLSSDQSAKQNEDIDTCQAAVLPDNDSAKVSRLIDWEGLEQQFKGKTAFILRLASIMQSSSAETPAKLRAAANAADYQQMTFIVHGLKGTAGNMRIHSLHALAEQAEISARTNQQQAPELVRQLADLLDAALVELQLHIQSRRE